MSGTTDPRTELPEGSIARFATRVGASLRGGVDGRGLRVALAGGLFNGGITARLVDGALCGLAAAGVDRRDVSLAWVPGAFELPLVARAFAEQGVDAVVCLGAVIRGDTGHYDFVAGECAAGLQRVQLDTGVPVVFGVLTTDTVDQALERSTVPDPPLAEADWGGNKGLEASRTAIEMARLLGAPALAPVGSGAADRPGSGGS